MLQKTAGRVTASAELQLGTQQKASRLIAQAIARVLAVNWTKCSRKWCAGNSRNLPTEEIFLTPSFNVLDLAEANPIRTSLSLLSSEIYCPLNTVLSHTRLLLYRKKKKKVCVSRATAMTWARKETLAFLPHKDLGELSPPAAGCVLSQRGCFRACSKTNCSVNRKPSWQQTCCRWLQILQRERQWPPILPKTKEPAWSSAHESLLSSPGGISRQGRCPGFPSRGTSETSSMEQQWCPSSWGHGTVHRTSQIP